MQQDSTADRERATLEARLAAHHQRHFPGETTDVSWAPISPGLMFSEGKPSTSSTVSCFLAHQTTLPPARAVHARVCDVWTELTGCTDHEAAVSMTETDLTETE